MTKRKRRRRPPFKVAHFVLLAGGGFIFCIQTDGEENSSREHTHEELKGSPM